MKLPSMQFYPEDWLRDSVAGCSLAAQGLWLRLMILAHDSERYGHLCQNGSPIPPEQLARRCGCSLVEFERLLAELESAGVPSRTKDNSIFSRRMVRDAETRAGAAERKRKERTKSRDGPSDVAGPSHESHNASSSSSSSSDRDSAKADAGAPGSEKTPSVIWNLGIGILTAAGVSEQAARSFLGSQIKHYGKDAVAHAITTMTMLRMAPVEPKAFLIGILKQGNDQQEQYEPDDPFRKQYPHLAH